MMFRFGAAAAAGLLPGTIVSTTKFGNEREAPASEALPVDATIFKPPLNHAS